MIRKIFAAGLLILSVFTIIFARASNQHETLWFNPTKTDDWIIWGIAAISMTISIFLFIKRSKKN